MLAKVSAPFANMYQAEDAHTTYAKQVNKLCFGIIFWMISIKPKP